MAYEVDSLQIQIESDASKANSSLNDLASSLEKMAEASKTLNADTMKGVATSIQGLVRSLNGSGKMAGFSSSIITLNESLKAAEGVSDRVSSIAESLGKLNGITAPKGLGSFASFIDRISESSSDSSKVAYTISNISSALKGMTEVQIPKNLGSLSKFVSGMSEVDTDTVSSYSKAIEKLGGSLGSMKGVQVPKGLNSVASFIKESSNIGDADKASSGISRLAMSLHAFDTVDGTNVGNVGRGLADMASSLGSMDIDDAKIESIRKVVPLIREINEGIGSFNNDVRINIRIDENGIKKAEKQIEELSGEAQKSVSTSSESDKVASDPTGIGERADTIEKNISRIQSLANEYRKTIKEFQKDPSSLKVGAYEDAQKNLPGMEALLGEYGKFQKTGASPFANVFNGVNASDDELKQFGQDAIAMMQQAERLKEGINSAASAFNSLGVAMNGLGAGNMQSLFGSLSGVMRTIDSSSGIGMAIGSIGIGLSKIAPVVGVAVSAVKTFINVFETLEKVGDRAVQGVISAVQKLSGYVQRAIGTVKNLVSAVAELDQRFGFASVAKKAFAGISDYIGGFRKRMEKSFNNMSKNISKQFRTFFYMGFRKVFTALYDEAKDSFERLAQYSDSIGSAFNKNVSDIVANFHYLGNSIMAAIEPIINAITPVIDWITDRVVNLLNLINQLLNALGGGVTWTKAIKGAGNFAQDLDKAGKSAAKLKGTILGFDEINRLDDNNKGSSGDSALGGLNGNFETKPISDQIKKLAESMKGPDWTEFGNKIGEGMINAMENIPWGKIQMSAQKLGSRLATMLNGIFESSDMGKSWGWWIGHTLQQAINTGIHFANSFGKKLNWKLLGKTIADGIRGMLDTIDWNLIYGTLIIYAKGITDALNEFFRRKDIFKDAGKAVGKAFNGVLNAVNFAIKNFHWRDAGDSIALFLGNALTTINWHGVGTTLSNALNSVFDMIRGFVDEFPWNTLAVDLADGINTFLDGIKWEDIQATVIEAVGKITEGLNNFIEKIDPNEFGNAIAQYINTFIYAFAEFIDTFDFGQLGTKLGDAVKTAFVNTDWVTLGTSVGEGITNFIEGIGNFVETADFGTITQNILDGIKAAMENITWEDVSESMRKIGNAIKDAFDRIIADKTFWEDLGKTLGGAVHSLFDGLSAMLEDESQIDQLVEDIQITIQNFLDSLTVDDVSETINKLVSGVCKLITDTLNSDGVKELNEGIKSVVDNLPWNDISDAIVAVMREKHFIGSLKAKIGAEIALAKVEGTILGWSDFIDENSFTSGMGRLGEKTGKGFRNIFDESGIVRNVTVATHPVLGAVLNGLRFADKVNEQLKEEGAKVDASNFNLWEPISKGLEGAKEHTTYWLDENEFVDNSKLSENTKSSFTTALGDVIDGIGTWWDTQWQTTSDNIAAHTGTTMQASMANVHLWDSIKDAFGDLKVNIPAIFEGIKEKVTDVWSGVSGWFESVASNIGSAFSTVKETIGEAFSTAKEKVVEVWGTVYGWFHDTIIQPLSDKWTEFKETVGGVFTTLWENIQEVWGYVTGWFDETIVAPLTEKWTTFKDTVGGLFSSLWEDIKGVWNTVSGWFDEHIVTPIRKLFDDVTGDIGGFFSDLWDDVKEGVHTAFGTAVGVIEDAVNGIITIINGVINGLNLLIDAKNKLPSTNKTSKFELLDKVSFKGFAEGGFPQSGELYMANENGFGSEMIGQMGNRHVVANNDQIINGIRAGVAEAIVNTLPQFVNAGGGDVVLYLGDEEVARAAMRGQQRLDKRYNPAIQLG